MQFNAIIEQDKDGFYAYVPSLQGCVSQGGTLEEHVLPVARLPSGALHCILAAAGSLFFPALATIFNRGNTL